MCYNSGMRKHIVYLIKDDGSLYDWAEATFYKYKTVKNKEPIFFRTAIDGEKATIVKTQVDGMEVQLEKPLHVFMGITPHFGKGQLFYETN